MKLLETGSITNIYVQGRKEKKEKKQEAETNDGKQDMKRKPEI